MITTAPKTAKTAPVIPQGTAVKNFFKKAGEAAFFESPKQSKFFGSPMQTKLTVSSPEDPQEREADAVAEKVMAMPEPSQEPTIASQEVKRQKTSIQRKCAHYASQDNDPGTT